MTAMTLYASGKMLGRVALLGLMVGVFVFLWLNFSPLSGQANNTGEGAVHVCVNNSTGAMRYVTNPNHCRSYEQLVDLGATGQVNGHQIVEVTTDVGAGSFGAATASCPDGKHVIGGGTYSTWADKNNAVLSSRPSFRGTSWSGQYINNSEFKAELSVYAICAETDFVYVSP